MEKSYINIDLLHFFLLLWLLEHLHITHRCKILMLYAHIFFPTSQNLFFTRFEKRDLTGLILLISFRTFQTLTNLFISTAHLLLSSLYGFHRVPLSPAITIPENPPLPITHARRMFKGRQYLPMSDRFRLASSRSRPLDVSCVAIIQE